MNKKFWFLTKSSIAKKMKSKWFVIINFLLMLLIVGIINIDSVITFFGGDFEDKLEIVVIDETNEVGDSFKATIKENEKVFGEEGVVEVEKSEKTQEEEEKNIEDKVLVVFDKNNDATLTAKIISQKKIDSIDYQLITSSLTSTKYSYELMHSNIDPVELAKISEPITIDRIVLDENENSTDDNMNMIMGTIFPTIILPFFMLIIFLVQMIGAEIYEEKSSRSMEIIISNVSPKVHFLSKIVAANTFAITQGFLLLIYAGIGLLVRNYLGDGGIGATLTSEMKEIWDSLVESGFVEKLVYIIPLTLVLLVLSFFAYSLTAGILASMTVNMEDYQQIQTPIMIVLLIAYYLAIMAGMFDGSIFIKVLSYVPFISCLLSPALLMINQVTIVDVLISVLLLVVFNVFIFKKGLKIYKEGILNYSSEKVWIKFKKAVKTNDR